MYSDLKKWLLLVGMAAALALGLFTARWLMQEPASEPANYSAALVYPQPRAISDFELNEGPDAPLTKEHLQGEWSLLFFGFTHCPDICPTTLFKLGQVQQAFEEADRQAPRIVFVSVDPKRDDDAAIQSYLDSFSQQAIGVTESNDEELTAFAAQLGAVYQRTGEGDDYNVGHTAKVFVLNPEAELVAVFDHEEPLKAIVDDLQQLLPEEQS